MWRMPFDITRLITAAILSCAYCGLVTMGLYSLLTF